VNRALHIYPWKYSPQGLYTFSIYGPYKEIRVQYEIRTHLIKSLFKLGKWIIIIFFITQLI